jgi:small-conductance mechanosensitive channel
MEAPEGWLASIHLAGVIRALLVLGVGILLARFAGRGVGRMLAQHPDRQMAMLASKGAVWLIGGLALVMALRELGFQIGVLLGAAGILSVAIGFASQTSASNLISGLFLLGEKPFGVGDVITIGDTRGEVLSIDSLSVKLRTFDNIFVRIPNESIIKDRVQTLTRFPIRRFDLKLTVRFDEDLDRLEASLRRTAEATPLALVDPRPLFLNLGFEEYGLGIQFSVWATQANWMGLRNALVRDVRDTLIREGVEIPYRRVRVEEGASGDARAAAVATATGSGAATGTGAGPGTGSV